MDDLLGFAQDNGVRVMWRDLGRRRGEYRHGPQLIVVNPRLTAAMQRSTLAHELGHWWHADEWTDDPAVLAARERRANAYAAVRLIDPRRYAAAEREVGPHPGAIARELGVARYVVDAWQEQRGRLAYVPAPRRSASA